MKKYCNRAYQNDMVPQGKGSSAVSDNGGNNHNRLYLVMPAYNEAASIGQVLREWMIVLKAEGINWKIVVADSGSTDETHNILKKMCAVCPRLEILSGTGTGHGPKVAALYQYAVRCGADYIFQTNSDGQTRPEEFCRFWKLRHRYRAILGMRPVRGDGKSREWVERILCRMLYRLCCKNIYAFISLLVSVSLLWKYFEGGNLVEEYAMPFIAISLYIYLDYLIHNKIHAVRLCVCGLSFGAVCLLRPNMVSVWIVFSLAVCVRLVVTGDISRIWYFLVWFVAGFCVIELPVVFWLAASHSLHAFVECYFHFNFVYSSAEGGGATAGAKWNSFFTFLNSMPVLLSTASCCMLFKRKDRFLYGIYLIYLVCTLVFICISGHTFGHYGMILVPAVAFPIASFLDDCVLRAEGKGLPVCLAMYFLVPVAQPDWMSAAGRVISTYENRGEEHRGGLVLEVCRIVGEHTEKDDKISVYGNRDIIYILSSRMHATRYSYQIPVGNIMPELMDDYFRQLGEEQPPVILTAPGFMDERLNSFVQQYHYKEIWSESGTIIYLNESAVRGTG